MNRFFRYIFFAFPFFAIGVFAYFVYINTSKINVLDTEYIYPGVGWINNESVYSGSELSFAFNNSSSITFDFSTDSKADQVIEIFINESRYEMSSPNLSSQKLTIELDENKPFSVTARHTCSRIDHPCQLKVVGIYIDRKARLTNYQKNSKTLTVFGDSISTIYANSNYTQIMADALGYELRNVSSNGQTISKVKGYENTIDKYQNVTMNYFSDVTIIFLGSNDAVNNVSLSEFGTDYSLIVRGLKNNNPDLKLILVSPLKRTDVANDKMDKYIEVIHQIAQENNAVFVDTRNWLLDTDLVDGVHPSLESQIKLKRNFESVLKSII